jgi:hypothetical protein
MFEETFPTGEQAPQKTSTLKNQDQEKIFF